MKHLKYRVNIVRMTETRGDIVICNHTAEAAYKRLAQYEDAEEKLKKEIDRIRGKDPQKLSVESQLADVFFRWLEKRFNAII